MFLGLTWQHTRGSALIGWVKHDAEYIAERIREYQGFDARQSGEAPVNRDPIRETAARGEATQ